VPLKCSPAVGAATDPFSSREYRLIAVSVGRLVGTLDIRRQWDVADLFEFRKKVALVREANRALPELSACQYFRIETRLLPWTRKSNSLPDTHLTAWTNERFPIFAIRAHGPQQKDFHFTTQILVTLGIALADWQSADSGAMSKQACGKDLRIVEDEAVSWPQE